METIEPGLPVFLLVACVAGFAVFLLLLGNIFNPGRTSRVKQMPYESGMDPIHDTRRRLNVRFHLLAIAFLVFDVELLFLYPWAVTARPARVAASAMQPTESVPPAQAETTALDSTAATLQRSSSGMLLVEHRHTVFAGVMIFIALLAVGLVYDWRKGVFQWR